ncbi:2OG-Fe(II) oxygenase [Stutzerimonas urumqiensis]|uniref:2OG-Fe(II) oxygenase n=1 Tax=Stutzerimonas urumqiensis TaxID=638269 RepID=UPI003BAB2FB9
MQFDPLIEGLAARGWSVQPCFLANDLTAELAAECRRLAAGDALSPAGIGRGSAQVVHEAIRGDHILWLDEGFSPVCDRYLTLMASLRQALNQAFFLGLDEFECHFAAYPPGAFYKTHLDRFRDDDRRTVSVVLYLNPDWQPGDGGELRLHLPGLEPVDVAPVAGTLAVFLSGEVPHEVLPTATERLSLTGWFKRRATSVL